MDEEWIMAEGMLLIIELILAAGLGIITGVLARRKGRSFWGWWFFGMMLFIVAFPVVLLIGPARHLRRKCPYCLSWIHVEARICPYCRMNLPERGLASLTHDEEDDRRPQKPGETEQPGPHVAKVRARCPECGAKLQAPADKKGHAAKCPRCGGRVEIPFGAPPVNDDDT